jgi:ribosomal RNA-processing protein 36
MPRRPRPSTRPPPKNSSLLSSRKALQNSKAIARKHVPTPSLEDSAEEEGGHDNFFVQGHSGYPNISGSEDDATDDDSEIEDIPEPEDEDEVDVDAPRVAQWEDDDDFDSEADMESSEEDAEDAAADQDPRLVRCFCHLKEKKRSI